MSQETPLRGAENIPSSPWSQAERLLFSAFIPAGTFGTSATSKRTEFCSRLFLLILYLIVSLGIGVLLYSFVKGQVQIQSVKVYHRELETPSVAFCPFEIKERLHPKGTIDVKIVYDNLGKKKQQRLHNLTAVCPFDNACICANLSNHTLLSVRDFVDVKTNATQDMRLFKVGFYDSVGSEPSWFYLESGKFSLGNISLLSVRVRDVDIIANMVKNSSGIEAFYNVEHREYRWLFNSVQLETTNNAIKKGGISRIRFQFASFFVEEMFSFTSQYSLFAFVTLLTVCLAMLNNLALFNVLFPISFSRRTVSPFVKLMSCGTLSEDYNIIEPGAANEWSSANVVQ
eukprot:Filipodium_phascolosomae@DN4568_c0_g1_i1.p1